MKVPSLYCACNDLGGLISVGCSRFLEIGIQHCLGRCGKLHRICKCRIMCIGFVMCSVLKKEFI